MTVLCMGLGALLLAGRPIADGDFEAKPTAAAPVPGWSVGIGATNGALEPVSALDLDPRERHKGRASLRLHGDDTTRAWRTVQQDAPARPGGTYTLRAFAKAQNVRGETVRGTSIRQFQNCFVGLVLFDGSGDVVAKDYRQPMLPTSGWQPLEMKVVAPDTVRSARISISLTMSGTLWVDDVDLAIDGGRELPPPEVLVREGFENASALPPRWSEELGATNGGGDARSTVAIDPDQGAQGTRHSLKLMGEAATIRWYGVERKLDARPGDAFRFGAWVRGKDIRKEGIQFPNFHIRLVFLGKDGEPLGAARHAHGGEGTFDWKPIETAGVAPDGTTQVIAGIFLSMSGEAWLDQLEITRQPGSTPAYTGWQRIETKHIVLRYPKDHPHAAEMSRLGARLEKAYEDIVKRLDVRFGEKITVYVYRDGEDGKRLTGRELDYANPEGRAVHQRFESTAGHEMAHVIALELGYSQTGLFGEGLAVWLNGDAPREHHAQAAKLLKDGKLPSLDALLTRFRDEASAYPAAGSFCGYLIEKHGLGAFKKLYPLPDPARASREVLGASLEDVDAAWRKSLE
jgi:hypothetical protein